MAYCKPPFCMKSRSLLLCSLCVVTVLLAACSSLRGTSAYHAPVRELILGGDDKVMIIDLNKSTETQKSITWEIKAVDIKGLPSDYLPLMRTVDDHKSVDRNRKLLICSSSGAAVLVDRKTRTALFYAKVPAAHSVDYLPGKRIAVALSTGNGGNRLSIYDEALSDQPLFSDSLYSGHGVVWNRSQKRLYALGYDELRAYSLSDWKSDRPKLKLEQRWKLPETGGHELFASSDDTFLISTSRSVWRFRISDGSFAPFEPIANVPDVKSVYYNEKSRQLIYTKAEISWWTHNVYMENPEKVIRVPEMDLYKVRTVK